LQESDNKAAKYIHLGRSPTTIERSYSILTLSNLYLIAGVLTKRLEQYPQAIADYTSAIEVHTNFSLAYFQRGYFYHNSLQQAQKALADFNKAIELNLNKAGVYFSRGYVYYDLKQYSQAIADYDKAISLNTRYGEAYLLRGVSYALLGDNLKAISDVEKATQLLCQQKSPDCQQAKTILRQLQTRKN
jgi:tetratricopeptide (TPR) repeat protein